MQPGRLSFGYKLHPRTARGKHASSFHELKEATILSNTNFSKLVYFSEKCISHYSTTLIYPILLNKPILIPRWGRSAEQITLYTPKEVTFVNSLDELKRYIVSKDFSYDRSDYLRNYVSFTDGKTDERIVGHILNQI
ncbi:MAG: hypothetical protein IPI93_15250 [Sphingobacteriaceae bacterium]|nr:hypothetical protein [Sphingobacteriaceae bacterium]